MNKNFLFSICLLVGAFSVKGQFKQSIGFNTTYPGFSLDYERFVYAKNNHHLSLRGAVGFSIRYNDIMFGTDFIYGFGKHHRFEASYYLGFLPNNIINSANDFYSLPATLTTGVRLNYAYHAKNNPMIYRVGIMPLRELFIWQNQENFSRWLGSFSIGIGYRF